VAAEELALHYEERCWFYLNIFGVNL